MSVYRTSVEGLEALSSACLRAFGLLAPPQPLTLSQWADKFAYVPPEAGAFPGKFFTDRAEYQRGMQDAVTDRNIETVVYMLCAQSGKTQVQMNTVGYFTHHEPAPMLFIQASEGEAEKFSKNRIAKMIRTTPVLRKLYPSPRARDSGNTLLNKEFPGGVLILAGANAPAGLASMPIRVLELDEVDRYPESAGTEGDPVDLAIKRTTTFWNRVIVMASTPGVKGVSRIEPAYEDSDRRKYFVPCPECGLMQVLEWPRLRYESSGETGPVQELWYECLAGCRIEERHKHQMVRAGEWRTTAASRDGKTAGFHLNALYPPWVKWMDLVNEWRSVRGSLERRKTFINTRLAETWEIRGKGAETSQLESRKDTRDYADRLPVGVLLLTAGVDVQDDRLEASVWGWGLDEERWVIDHQVFRGDPSLPEVTGGKLNEDSPWAALQAYLRRDFEHESGLTFRVRSALIDSAGHHTQRVYDFCKKNEARRWFAIVGRAGIGRPLVTRGTEQGPSRALLYTVGADTAKEDVYTSLNVATPGAGHTHFSSSLPPDFFQQITSEQLVKKKKDFITTLAWVKKSERNEALDCAVYARAAVAIIRPAWLAMHRNFLIAVERHAKAKVEEPEKRAILGAVENTEVGQAQGVRAVERVQPEETSETHKSPQQDRVQRLANAFGGRVVRGKGKGWGTTGTGNR